MRRYSDLVEPSNLGRATFLIERTKVIIPFPSLKSRLMIYIENCTA